MKSFVSVILLLSLLCAGNNVRAFQIQKLEKTEYPAPSAVMDKLRADYSYNKSIGHICYAETDNDKWATFENGLKSELKKSGIYEGATLWCKGTNSKNLELPALTKVTVKKIGILVKMYEQKGTDKPQCKDIYTLVTADVGGKEKVLEFGGYGYEEDRAYDVIRSFHTKNPSVKWSKKVITAIKEGKVFLGMTKTQATESWGEPDEVNRSVGSWGTKEQWVYGSKSYLYFTNDKLNSFQN